MPRYPVPPAVARYAEHFTDHAATALRALTERSMLVHGDIRADNLFFSRGQLKVVDFQLAARGVGASDIAYLVSQGLPTSLRAGRDEELVRGYLESLDGCGVDDYSLRRGVASLPIRRRLPDLPPSDRLDHLGIVAGAIPPAVPETYRARRGGH